MYAENVVAITSVASATATAAVVAVVVLLTFTLYESIHAFRQCGVRWRLLVNNLCTR